MPFSIDPPVEVTRAAAPAGTAVEELLAARSPTPAYEWDQSSFIRLGASYRDRPVSRPGVEHAQQPSGHLTALADILPAGVSRADAQATLETPFEFRAFFGGSTPAFADPRVRTDPGVLPSFLRQSAEQLCEHARRAVEGVPWLRVEVGPTLAVGASEIPVLRLRHQYGCAHWNALRDFARNWRRVVEGEGRAVPMPPIELIGTVPETSGTEIDSTQPLLARFGQLHHGQFQPIPEGISDAEYRQIAAWVQEVHGLRLPRHAAHRGLLALLSAPLREMRDVQIERTLDTHVALGTLSTFAADTFRELRRRYGARLADNHHRIYLDTHLKLDGVPLLILKQLLGADITLTTSSYSGHSIMRGLAELNGIDVEIPVGPTLAFVPGPRIPDLPRPGDPPLILERGGKVLSDWAKRHSTRDIRAAIADGRVTVLSHNSGDDQKLGSLLGAAPERRLNDTRVKRWEAHLIGERQILQAAEICREKWGRPIRDAHLVVAGAGLIGGGVVDAALAKGLAPDNILVVDADPDVRARFEALGCQVHDGIEPGVKRPFDFERAIVVHATTSPNLNLDNIFQFADESLVFSLVSGGKGVDWTASSTTRELDGGDPLFAPGHRGRLGDQWITGYDWGVHRQNYRDRTFESGDRRATIIADGFPPNLLEERWATRFELTTCLVAAVVMAAAAGETDVLPADLDEDMLARFRRDDEVAEHRFAGYDEATWNRLLADFRSD